MAGLFVQAYPPTSPLLNEYGSDLAAFIQGFAPAASVPYLADVARLEHLRINAYHAADTPVAEPQAVIDQLQQLPSLGNVRLHLHPSVSTLQSNYAVVALWAAHQTTDTVASLAKRLHYDGTEGLYRALERAGRRDRRGRAPLSVTVPCPRRCDRSRADAGGYAIHRSRPRAAPVPHRHRPRTGDPVEC